MSKLSNYLVSSSILWVCNLALPSVALASGINETDIGQVATELPAETKTEIAAATPVVETKNFISDGSVMPLENLGITIAPPTNWEIVTNGGTLSVVMREQREPAPAYEKPKYQRNITVAAIHKSSPIDEQRAVELKAELVKNFSSDSLVSNFTILEHKFFDYRGKNDGLLIYSNLNVGEYPMMQMHILVSGAEKQFLLTYTDLAERFSDSTVGFYEKAWASMVSTQVTGFSPNRMDTYMRYGALAGGVFMFGLIGILFRRKASKHDYSSDADQLMDSNDEPSTSMISTMHGGWKLVDGDVGGDDFSFSSHAAVNLRTKQTEYVSNY
jgi:hypothetical protein